MGRVFSKINGESHIYLHAFSNLEFRSMTSQLVLSPSPPLSHSFIDYFSIQIELTSVPGVAANRKVHEQWFSSLPSNVKCVMVSKFVDIKNLEFIQAVMHRE